MHTSYKSIFSLHVLKEKAGDLFIPCCFSYCCIHTLVLLVSHCSKEVILVLVLNMSTTLVIVHKRQELHKTFWHHCCSLKDNVTTDWCKRSLLCWHSKLKHFPMSYGQLDDGCSTFPPNSPIHFPQTLRTEVMQACEPQAQKEMENSSAAAYEGK